MVDERGNGKGLRYGYGGCFSRLSPATSYLVWQRLFPVLMTSLPSHFLMRFLPLSWSSSALFSSILPLPAHSFHFV